MSLTNAHSFAEKVLRGLKGEQGIVEPCYIYLPGVTGGDAIAKETGVDFFSVPVQLGVSPHYLRTITDSNLTTNRPAEPRRP
jgi:hypothetical protein